MQSTDYIYRFDPNDPELNRNPTDSDQAKRDLEAGNRTFSEWVRSCEIANLAPHESQYVIKCGGIHVAKSLTETAVIHQQPFAVVIGCSDARVPIEMILGQSFNELFVVRVAGNVLADECWGSVDYAVKEFSKSIKLIVVLGHSGCGAVTAAVDAYLDPKRFSMGNTSFVIRSVLDHIFVPVHHAAKGLLAVWGPDAANQPGYRDALIQSAVFLNAATAAFNLRVGNRQIHNAEVRVLYGVYSLQNHHIVVPASAGNPAATEPEVGLVDAPADADEFEALSCRIASQLKANR